MTLMQKIETLPSMTVKDLRLQYTEVFGDQTNAHNKDWLVKRIAWRLQAQAMGGLSERAKQRAKDLANEADLRVIAPATIPMMTTMGASRDARLPMPGTIIERSYKGQTYYVEVLTDGFIWNGQTYPTLRKVAKAITGQHLNGFAFFGLTRGGAE